MGKMIGVMYGRSMEFKATGKPYTNQILWKPEMLEGALLEDDIYGQLNFMMTMENMVLMYLWILWPKDLHTLNFHYVMQICKRVRIICPEYLLILWLR